MITVLFAPTSLVITTNSPPSITNLVERDAKTGLMTKINLPDRLILMGNHQAYTDWMYMWILACYAGHAKGIIILLKASLKRIPVIGWGMVRHHHRLRPDQRDSNSSTSSSLTVLGRLTSPISPSPSLNSVKKLDPRTRGYLPPRVKRLTRSLPSYPAGGGTIVGLYGCSSSRKERSPVTRSESRVSSTPKERQL